MSRYPGSYPRDSHRNDGRRDHADEQQYTRLFILASKGMKEDFFRSVFGKYGHIKDVWNVKDRRTNEDKGITYITFSKASEAALAMEELNGQSLDDHPRPLKVMIASDRQYGSGKEPKEEEKMLRLFVMVPKTYNEQDLRGAFEEFGDIEYVTVLKDKYTDENKGFGYVKFHRAYHAALALEKCDRMFKPKFAEPRMTPSEREELNYRRESDRLLRDRRDERYMERDPYPSSRHSAPMSMAHSQVSSASVYGDMNEGGDCLSVLTSNTVNEEQLRRLFDLIPDFEYCELDHMSGIATVKYSTRGAAAYALRKLDGFEYPIGYRLGVKLTESSGGLHGSSREQETQRQLQSLFRDPLAGNFQSLVDTINKATTIIQAAGLGGMSSQAPGNPNYTCSVTLPAKQPLAEPTAPVAQRLFLVFHDGKIPSSMLIDIFCRFGELIEVYMITGKNFGYAKYASKDSALRAMETLHLQEINGYRIKVIEADPPKYEESTRKRARSDD